MNRQNGNKSEGGSNNKQNNRQNGNNRNRSQIENSKSAHGSISRVNDKSKQKGFNRNNSMQHSM